jgi:hypothetical protein
MTSRALAVWGLLGAILSACGGGGDGLSLDEYGARAKTVVCQYGVRCGSLPDQASCAYDVDLRQARADIQSGKVIYDGTAAEACLDSFGARGCNLSEIFVSSAACQRAATGTLVDGAACGSGDQCVSKICEQASATCDTSTTCCPGTCGPTRAAEGEDCSGGQGCVSGTYCDSTGTTQVCKKRAALGAACSPLLPCLENLRCAGATASTQGTCTAYPKRGEPCATGGLACDDTRDTCDATTKTCVARVGVGGDCAAAPEGCLELAACDPATQKCVAKSALGVACTPEIGCLAPLACVNGTCEKQPLHPVCP